MRAGADCRGLSAGGGSYLSIPGGYTHLNNTQGEVSLAGTGGGTLTNTSISSYRIGDRLFVSGYFVLGTVAAALLYIQLPAGLNINTAAMGPATTPQLVGWGLEGPAATGALNASLLALFYDGATSNQVFFAGRAGTGSTAPFLKDNGSAIFSSSQPAVFKFDVPILQWSQGT